ncbi:MAG: AEC family transporter [Chloroflexota bacterium]
MLSIFYNVIAPVALITCLAYIVGRLFQVDTRPLSKVIIYLATPALIFSSLSKSTLRADDLGELASVGILSTVLMALIGWMVSRFLNLDKRSTSAFVLGTSVANAGNFGLPLTTFAFGEDGLSRGIVLFIIFNILYNTVGIFIAASGSASPRHAMMNILRVPNPYVAAVALMVNLGEYAVPIPIERGLDLLGQASLPLMIVILGLRLANTQITGQLLHVGIAAGIRILIAPIIAILLTTILAVETPNANVLILISSMPTAVLTIVYAEEFGSDADFLSSVVLVSTLGSFLSLSVLLTFLPTIS